MPRGKKVKQKQGAETKTREPLADPQPPPTRLEVVIQRNQAQLLSMLSGVVSDISEMKRSLITPKIKLPPLHIQEKTMKKSLPDSPPPPTIDNLTFNRVDAICEILEAVMVSILTGLVSDMSEMKCFITPEMNIILPLHIQEEIMIRLPVKSLVRFRSVSRSWKSLIDSSQFIGAHSRRFQPHHVLVEHTGCEKEVKYVSFADNDYFPHLGFIPALPPSFGRSRLAGSSSYGLLCLQCYDRKSGKVTPVIWNPSIRKLITIDLPQGLYHVDTLLGFGVCPITLDPKIVLITPSCPPTATSNFEESKFLQVYVYNLSSGGGFRNISSSNSNLPSISKRVSSSLRYVVIGRLIYWCVEVHSGVEKFRNLIMSFDITEEKFNKVVELPDCLASLCNRLLSVSNLRDSLIVFESKQESDSYVVWKMMDHGLLFTKLLTIKTPRERLWIRGVSFRKTGRPSMEWPSSGYLSEHVLYEPNSKLINALISGEIHFMESYMETLLLIGHSDCINSSKTPHTKQKAQL